MALINGYDVTGTDINLTELSQAQRVFSHIPYLQFVPGGINAERIGDEEYDLIVFAASIQYFSSLKEIINLAMGKLRTNGEIHILDSVFYKSGEIQAAKVRTAKYYRDLGFPEMTEHYFHHSTDELNSFRFKTLYQPSLIKQFSNNKNPFPWFCIKKQ
jgi:ubiquinone/menaquinone biosynthesis C-methylase UbiE